MTQNTVRAFQWTSDPSFEKAPAWLQEASRQRRVRVGTARYPNVDLIVVHPGNRDLSICGPGDWVTIDSRGSLETVQRADFSERYVVAGEEPEPAQDITSLLREILCERDAGSLKSITLDLVSERASKRRPSVSKVYRLAEGLG
jgi:hypothetical protein